jgi:hypothetical protein
MVEKVLVTYYSMHYNNIIGNVFTKDARGRIYFRNTNNNKLCYDVDGNEVVMPFTYNKDLFSKCEINLYPIGAHIADKRNNNVHGEIVYYIMEGNLYVVKNGCNSMHSIHFDDSIIENVYYFISSSGKVQREVVGRDGLSDNFRKKTNNYFENKEDAVKKLNEICSNIK